MNPNAIHLLEQNVDKIDWAWLSSNPNAIDLLKRNVDKINWFYLSSNPNAMDILQQNQAKIQLKWLSDNPSLFTYDYDAMKKATSLFHEELIQKVLHPRRLVKYLETYDYDIASEEYYSTF
ncbi:hypothetical protein 162280994 [Organic Lake phycodnavirus]|nr:hypothetical protein 162285284 [Organic Lake phycodnavirus 1]ADX06621.1 hypothetical protein 162280994 [Organic Lake phycodnavirus]